MRGIRRRRLTLDVLDKIYPISYNEFMVGELGGKTEKINIPNENMIEWIRILREGGFTDKEMDRALTHLNQEYAELKMPPHVREALKRVISRLEEERGRKITPAEKDSLLKVIQSRLDPTSLI